MKLAVFRDKDRVHLHDLVSKSATRLKTGFRTAKSAFKVATPSLRPTTQLRKYSPDTFPSLSPDTFPSL